MQRLVATYELAKSFGATRALDRCSLEILPGEIHALVGENGSGKSTLIKLLSGVIAPDSGSIVWNGAPARFQRPGQAQAAGVATVFQETLVAEELSVRDNIFVGSDGFVRKTHRRAEENALAREVLQRVGARDLPLEAPLWRLSLSQRQLVTIARALVRPWRLLILDEPTSALDVEEREGLFSFLRCVREEGTAAVLLVSHRMDEIVDLADRATVLRSGRQVASLVRSEITSETLVTLMTHSEDVGVAAAAAPPAEAAPARRLGSRPAQDSLRLLAEQVVLRERAEPFRVELLDREAVGVAGLDGHGQVGFLEAVVGLRRPHGGEIRIASDDGSLVPVRSFQDGFRKGIAYVPRDRKREGLFTPLSILDNVGLTVLRRYSRLGVIRRNRLRAEMEQLLDVLQLRGGSLDAGVGTLSGGNQQKILLGRWLATSPSLLVLNDPMRGVDLGVKRQFYGLLRQLRNDGMAVLMLSTEVDELLEVSDRVIVFHAHSVSAELRGTQVTRENIVSAMFGRLREDD